MEEERRQRVWVLYGWFSGLMCVGSVFGAVTWAFWMQTIVALFNSLTPGLSLAQNYSFAAQYQYWGAAFYVPYAIEFLCLSVAKLLVLHRMADFAVAKEDGMRRRLAVGGRAVMAAVVVGNVVGLCGNVAAAVYAKEAGDLTSAAAAAYAANNTDGGVNFSNQANQKIYDEDVASSVQMFCEVAVLLIIIAAFAVVGIACARLVSSALRLRDLNDEHVEAVGRQLRQKIVGTGSFVFVTFLLRAVFAIMNAVSLARQNQDAACAATDTNLCDPQCFNVWYIMQQWLLYTPEFQLTVVLISSPIALIVALWGMTSERTLQYMRSSGKQMVAIGESAELRAR
jgi:hypothetical protein